MLARGGTPQALFGMSGIRSIVLLALRLDASTKRGGTIEYSVQRDPGISLARSHAFNIRRPQELRAKLLLPRTSPPGPFFQPRVRSQNRARDLGDGG